MKRIGVYMIAAATFIATACTNDFEEINKDPNSVEEIDPGFQFGKIQLSLAGDAHEEWRGNLILTGPISGVMQCGYRTGQGFQTSDSYSEAKWSALYGGAIKNGRDMNRVMEENNEDGIWDAKIAQTNIILEMTFQRLTDAYGDIPYSEAGYGYGEGVLYPKYDSQEDVYRGMVASLKESRDLLLSTESETFDVDEDIIYGHVNSSERAETWARLANSMLLRIGMRASSADAAWAREVVEEAANHSAGFINSYDNSNSAMVNHTSVGGAWGSHTNGSGTAINGLAGGFAHAYLGEEYLRMAQQNRDPRLFYVGAQIISKDGAYLPWTGQTKFDPFVEAARPGEPWKAAIFTPERGGGTESYSVRGAKQIDGARVYTDFFITESNFGNELSYGDFTTLYDAEWAQYHTLVGFNPQTVGSVTAPTVLFGADESYYILAEAALNGWSVSGSPVGNLRSALLLSMPVYRDIYPTDGSPEVYMSKYAETVGESISFDTMSDEYIESILSNTVTEELIWTERWKSLVINGYEAFALWNRTEMSVTPINRPYNDAENIDLPDYTPANMASIELGVSIEADGFTSQPFHDGGVTGGIRPRRLDYPNDERSNNISNSEAAIAAQELFGNAGSNFISNKMWISK